MRIKKYTLVIVALVLSACSSQHVMDNRVTKQNYSQVSIQNATQYQEDEPFRFWGQEGPRFLLDKNTQSSPLKVNAERLNILALSGGGANGAFGAGVINGLYDAGQLPDYSIITGVSAGALIAPFVFTGGEDIHKLHDVMMTLDDAEVLGVKNFLNTLIKDAFTNGKSLFELMETLYDDAMIDRIAEQHRQGKRLFIGTTHFDSGRQITWNLGAIASSQFPARKRLIHQVLAASASIPGVFPPQFIDVEYQGEDYEELHVDGGLTYQMFFDPSSFDYGQLSDVLGLEQRPMVHVVRNGTLEASYKPVKDKGVDLLTRSLSSITLGQTRGDMYRMLYMSEINGYDIAFTYIDTWFSAHKKGNSMFDKEYMSNLYKYGYRKAQGSSLWVMGAPEL